MKTRRPEKEDFEAAWKLLRMLNLVYHGLNPLKPLDDEEFDFLWEEDKADVLDELVEVYENCDLEWLMMVLETLISPKNGIIDQNAETLEFSPELKALMAAAAGEKR